jgi:hypothetical protein
MKNRVVYVYSLFLALIFHAIPLNSTDFFGEKKRIISESAFKIGFFYFTPLFLLEKVGYTSSIYTYDNKEYPDWTGDIGLGLRTSLIVANRVILQAEDLPHYSYYLKNENLRSWSNRFVVSAISYMGPFNFDANFSRNDLEQRPHLEFSRPYRHIGNSWSGEVSFDRHSNLFVTAYAGFSTLAYNEDSYLGSYNLAESLNHRVKTFGVKINKRIFTETTVYANYERSEYKFDFRNERDAKAQKIALGVEFPEIGALQGSFQIGIQRFEPENALFRYVWGANGRGDIRLMLAERVRLNAYYGLDTSFSYGATDLYYHNNFFGGGADIYLTRFLKGGATFQFGRLKHHSFLDLATRRSDRVRSQRYYLAIPFIGNTSLGFSYNVYRLTSDALGLDYTRDFWGGFISYGF